MNYYMPPETAAASAASAAVYSAAPFILHVYRRLAKSRLRLKSENKKEAESRLGMGPLPGSSRGKRRQESRQ